MGPVKGQGPTIKAKGSEKWPVCFIAHIRGSFFMFDESCCISTNIEFIVP